MTDEAASEGRISCLPAHCPSPCRPRASALCDPRLGGHPARSHSGGADQQRRTGQATGAARGSSRDPALGTSVAYSSSRNGVRPRGSYGIHHRSKNLTFATPDGRSASAVWYRWRAPAGWWCCCRCWQLAQAPQRSRRRVLLLVGSRPCLRRRRTNRPLSLGTLKIQSIIRDEDGGPPTVMVQSQTFEAVGCALRRRRGNGVAKP